MADKSSHPIRNSIIATVIGGIILNVIFETIRNFTWKILELAGSFLSSIWKWIFSVHELKGWVVILLVIAIPVIFISVKFISDKKPEYFNYTEDFYAGAKWRWLWHDNNISKLLAFCPRCDGELICDDKTEYHIRERENKTDFICENCNHSIIASIPGNKDYALNAVEREIRRRIRTGEYKVA